MTKTLTSFSVIPKGVGRLDYSSAVSVTVESAISSWQETYYYRDVVTVPGAGSTLVEIPIQEGMVAVISDYFVSIPSNRLIRLTVLLPPPIGEVYDFVEYQQIQVHLIKPNYWTGTMQLRVYNYNVAVENNMLVGCAGYLATLEQYTQILQS